MNGSFSSETFLSIFSHISKENFNIISVFLLIFFLIMFITIDGLFLIKWAF